MSVAADAALAALGDPVRRRCLALLSAGEQAVGTLHRALGRDVPISQPAVSQHLKALRSAGLVAVRPDGARRLYRIDPKGISAIRAWLDALEDPLRPYEQHLDALATEVARGRRRTPAPDRLGRSQSA